MPLYDFTFPAALAGKTVVVRNSRGTTVASGPLGATANGDEECVFTASLAEDDYTCAPAEGFADADDVAGTLVATANAAAEFVANADPTNAASVAAAVDALRDSLIAAGLMADE